MTLLKRTLFGVFGVIQCVYAVQGKKNNNIIFHILYIIVAPLKRHLLHPVGT